MRPGPMDALFGLCWHGMPCNRGMFGYYPKPTAPAFARSHQGTPLLTLLDSSHCV